MTLLGHVLAPVASAEDARATADALEPYLDEIQRVTAVHVIEKAGGAIDKAPVEKRREDAAEFLAIVDAELGESVAVDTRIEFGTGVADTIVETGVDAGASAIAFRPRGESRIVQLITGDTANTLVTNPRLPVISLPDPSEA